MLPVVLLVNINYFTIIQQSRIRRSTINLFTGKITVLGAPLSNGFCADRPLIGYCPQSNCIYNTLTVKDHLRLFFVLKGGQGCWRNEADSLCEQLGLTNLMEKVSFTRFFNKTTGNYCSNTQVIDHL